MNIIDAVEMQEGAGVTVRRLFPFSNNTLVADPFVLWDDFSIGADAGFPTHAHRGFEAITYLFEGAMNHADNLGNNSTVTAGGAQRFTAGKGISHSEMPGGTETTKGIQLWINLPQALKGIDPAYQQVDAADIPVVTQDGICIRQIAGKQSPLLLKTAVEYDDIAMPAGSTYTRAVNADVQGVLYLHAGAITVNGEALAPGQAVLIKDMDQLSIAASENSRIMLALGEPHHEPVKLTGGFVD